MLRRRLVSAAAVAMIGLTGVWVAAPAHADDPISITGPSDGGVGPGSTNLPPLPPPKDSVIRPAAPACDPGWIFTPKAQYGNYHSQVGPALYNRNDTSQTANSKFTSEVTGTVGIAVEGSTEVQGGVFIASVKSSYKVSLSASLTAKMGNEISVSVPPRSGVYAAYGVWRLKVTGHNYYLDSICRTRNSTNPVVYGPRYVGWRIWAG